MVGLNLSSSAKFEVFGKLIVKYNYTVKPILGFGSPNEINFKLLIILF